MTIDFPVVIQRLDTLLKRGLCKGLGSADGQMCIEAAICQALGEPFAAEPKCVAPAVRRYKIRINDSMRWKSAGSRAEALRDIGIAQIGSAGIVDDREFARRVSERTVRVLIPALFRDVFFNNTRCMAAAERCEKEGNIDAAREAQSAAYGYAYAYSAAASAAAADAAADATADATATAADAAADAAAAAAYAYSAYSGKRDPEKYLRLSVSLALEVLRELNSPGCQWIEKEKINGN